MRYFHLCSTHLAPGSVIEPGNWGRIIRFFGTNHGRWLAETVMEDVRRREFEELPSRFSSAFFFDDENEARGYQITHASFHLLYEVELIDPSAVVHRADYRTNIPDGIESLDWCRRYWRGIHVEPDSSGRKCTELLAATGLKIIRIIE